MISIANKTINEPLFESHLQITKILFLRLTSILKKINIMEVESADGTHKLF